MSKHMTVPTRVPGDHDENDTCYLTHKKSGVGDPFSSSSSPFSSPLPKRLRRRLEETVKRYERREETRGDIEARLAAAEKNRQVRRAPPSPRRLRAFLVNSEGKCFLERTMERSQQCAAGSNPSATTPDYLIVPALCNEP
jgi:hypothetical protein